ncbi:D-alanyl-D-alanine carboxypeptidase [Desulfocapsa sulfexigens DSM 10523]|uniref:D-alanyl-D-alanine carboxypeptidase n=1 Tax=Desulfocapsa sulfexigens (strain DSM 10523 / SB164P1) TaxID=1167006 RepID=M1NI94_DESSD|nr:D-alanyl-D-alanine carboxypeptidase family protein [Desulfocapsa sulfexigens]AGF79299.1 D-alanyl-D-alanine carboxypeptidase [Desulfocapsa sulfexigens DSM 10523]
MDILSFLSHTSSEPFNRRTFLSLSCLATVSSLFLDSKHCFGQSEDEQRAAIYKKMLSGLRKIKDPDTNYPGDVWATPEQMVLIYSCYNKLSKVQNLVGYSNFNFIDLPTVAYAARQQRNTGRHLGGKPERTLPFTKLEEQFMDQIFAIDAKAYGFYGERVIYDKNYRINPKNLILTDGNFLRKGEAQEKYFRIKKQVSDNLSSGNNSISQSDMQVTSGIRNIPKQMRLFFRKAVRLTQVPRQSEVKILDLKSGTPQLAHVYDLKKDWNRIEADVAMLKNQSLPEILKRNERKEFVLDKGFHLINLSAASRSLAPPGYSWHAQHDFDIGLKNGKLKPYNFRKEFITTPLFVTLFSQGFIHLRDLRYRQENELGVRFEPWHIRVGDPGNLTSDIQTDPSQMWIPNRESQIT